MAETEQKFKAVRSAEKLQSLVDFIGEKADKTNRANLTPWLTENFGTRFEAAKNFLRSKEVSDEVFITGDVYKLGATSGNTRKAYKGEQIDEVIEHNFKNTPIFGELKK